MKKLVLIILYLLNASLIFTQSTSRFPIKPTSEWSVNYEIMDYDDSLYRNGDEIFKFFVENDTIINTVQYFKMYKTGIAYYDSVFSFDHIYIGAIRDADNKFFFVDKNKTVEDVLYDFELITGDTIRSLVEKNLIVSSIEILDDGRKKIKIAKMDYQLGKCMNFNNAYFIEGVGSMGGIFYPSPCHHVGYTEHYLVCYTEDGNLVYQSSLSPVNCNIAASVPLIDKNNPIINIYQVSSNRILTIEFEDLSEKPSLLYIYSILGSLVLVEKIKSNDNSIEIDIQNLKSGVHLIKIINNDFSFTKKIIVE